MLRRTIKWLLATIFTLFLVLIIVAAAAAYFINPNEFKPLIINKVREATGRNLSINGNIHWSFFPWLALSAEGIALQNPQGFSEQNFIQLRQVLLELRLLPLLSGHVEVSKIMLQNPTINLQVKANGQNNWTFPQVNNNNTQTSTNNKKFDLTIASLGISDGTLNFVNEQTKQNIAIQNLNFNVTNFGMDRQFPLKVSFLLIQQALKMNLDLQTKAKLQQDLIALNDLYFNSSLTNAKGNTINVKLNGDVQFDPTHKNLIAANLQGNAANNSFEIKVKSGAQNQYAGDVAINANNLNQLKQFFQLNMQGLERVAIKSPVQLSQSMINLNNLSGNFDRSKVSGSLNLALDPKQTTRFNLNIDQINVADYQGQQQQQKSSGKIDLSGLQNLDLQGQVQIGNLIAQQLQIKQFLAGITAKQANLIIDPLKGLIYKGSMNGSVRINAAAQPTFAVKNQLQNIDIAEATQSALKQKKVQLTGTANINTDIVTQGNNQNALLRNLNGNIQIAIKNGILKGVDLAKQLQNATAIANKQVPSKDGDTGQTPFGNLDMNMRINQGVSATQIHLDSPLMNIDGGGRIDLVSQQVDMTLNATAKGSLLNNNFLAKIQKELGGAIPLKVAGNLSQPKVYPDPEAIMRAVAKAEIQKQTNAVKDELNKKIPGLGDELQDSLGKFLTQ